MERKKQILRRLSGIVLLVAVMLMVLPRHPARAGEVTPIRHDLTFVEPVDVDIWEDGKNFYIRHNGVQKEYKPGANICDMVDYLVTVETYTDTDGELVTVVYFATVFLRREDGFLLPSAVKTASDDSVYRSIYLDTQDVMNARYNARIACVFIKGDDISNFLVVRDVYGRPGESGLVSADDGFAANNGAYGEHSGRIYQTPFLQGKYRVYCSKPIYEDEIGGKLLYPETPLPGVSSTSGEEGGLYKTTFRMLAGNATVYNTFYYTSCYLSGEDTISASGTVRMDATQLSDGTTHRQLLTAPQLLCQISSYGMAYDIVYTNDDNLCTLLGIEKPSPKYWDVIAQEWKGGTGGSSGGSSSAFAPVENLAVKMVGDKGLIDGARYNDYYVYGETSSSLDFKLDDVNVDVWGLGNYLSWNYSGKLYDEIGGTGSGSFGNSRDNIRQMRIVASLELLINGETVTKECVLTGGSNGATLSPAAGDFKLPMYYLQQQLRGALPGLNLKTQLKRVTYEVTPFYYSKAESKYYYGSASSISIDFQSAMGDYNGGDWSGGINDNWTEGSGDVLDWIKNIINTVASSVSWIGGVLTQGMGLFTKLGQIPAMMAGIIPFIPEELWTVVSFGILLYFAPAIVRGIRNLIIGGLK